MVSINILQYGCTANYDNGNILAGLLIENNHSIVNNTEEADVVIVNSCTVKGKTADKIHHKIRELIEEGKKLVVTGCMPSADNKILKEIAPKAALISTQNITEINNISYYPWQSDVKNIYQKAKLVLILNLMTKVGETDNFKASDYLKAFKYYLGVRVIDYVIANDNGLDPEILKVYKKDRQKPVEIDEQVCRKIAPETKIVRKKLAVYHIREHLFRHDPEKLAQTILQLDKR